MPDPVDRVDRRARRGAGSPWPGAAFLALSAVLALFALLFETGRAAFAAQAGVWLVVGLTVLAARRRRRR